MESLLKSMRLLLLEPSTTGSLMFRLASDLSLSLSLSLLISFSVADHTVDDSANFSLQLINKECFIAINKVIVLSNFYLLM